jgi:hypothetical protein
MSDLQVHLQSVSPPRLSTFYHMSPPDQAFLLVEVEQSRHPRSSLERLVELPIRVPEDSLKRKAPPSPPKVSVFNSINESDWATHRQSGCYGEMAFPRVVDVLRCRCIGGTGDWSDRLQVYDFAAVGVQSWGVVNGKCYASKELRRRFTTPPPTGERRIGRSPCPGNTLRPLRAPIHRSPPPQKR